MGADGLTGLPLIEALAAVLGETPVTAVFVDVDGLIWLNDVGGYTDGDRALRTIAGCIHDRALRHRGVAARIGGDEFVIVLPRGPMEDGSVLAVDLMADIDSLQIGIPRYEGSRCPFDTVGVSTLVFSLTAAMTEDRRRLVENLSQALWDAKVAAGRKGRVAGVVDGVQPAPPRWG